MTALAFQTSTPTPAPGRLTVDRLVYADGAAAIERLQGSQLLAAGKVSLIGLDAIRDRMDDRWPSKRANVWEHLERCIVRQLGATAFAVRVGETDYLVAQPELDRYAGQAACLSVLREVLSFFLGEARAADLRLRQVTALSEDGLDYAPVEPESLPAWEAVGGPASGRGPDAPVALTGPAVARRARSEPTWTELATQSGRTLRVSCATQPVFELAKLEIIGHRLSPKVIDLETGAVLDQAGVNALSWTDREQVDLAMLHRGLERLKAGQASTRKPSVVIPLAFSTLSSSRGRRALAQTFRLARAELALKSIVSVRSLLGVPAGRLKEIVSLLQPFCFAVVGHVAPERQQVKALEGCGLRGVAFEHDGRPCEDADLYGQLKTVREWARGIAPACIVGGLTEPRQLALARLAGLTHASLGAATPPARDADARLG